MARILKQRAFLGPAVGAAVLLIVAGWIAVAPSAVGDNYPVSLHIGDPSVVVVKSAGELHLFDGDTLVRTYSVTLGSEPVGQKVRTGDGRTPEGMFRVCSKKSDSPHHRFLGLDYPDPAAIERGLADGLISVGQANAMRRAIEHGECPSWTSALGGGIGIHGGATVEPVTAGCVGMTDADAEELFSVLRVGDVVEILP